MKFPKRWLNRLLCYCGIFGLLFQFTAAIHAYWHDIPLYNFWFLLLAPILCLASGLIPALQPQKEQPK
ncbi:hypothetical protein [Alishewanella longhuensis]